LNKDGISCGETRVVLVYNYGHGKLNIL